MANHDKGKSKRKGSGCLMCKPQKAPWAKKRGKLSAWTVGARSGRWLQENLGQLAEEEQIREHAAGWSCPCCGGDGLTTGCVWCGMPCPDDRHDWGDSDMEGPGWIQCKVCLADAYIEEGAA